jgi:hypothetical protein
MQTVIKKTSQEKILKVLPALRLIVPLALSVIFSINFVLKIKIPRPISAADIAANPLVSSADISSKGSIADTYKNMDVSQKLPASTNRILFLLSTAAFPRLLDITMKS